MRLTALYAAVPFGQNTPAWESSQATFPATKAATTRSHEPAVIRQVRTTNPSKECYA